MLDAHHKGRRPYQQKALMNSVFKIKRTFPLRTLYNKLLKIMVWSASPIGTT